MVLLLLASACPSADATPRMLIGKRVRTAMTSGTHWAFDALLVELNGKPGGIGRVGGVGKWMLGSQLNAPNWQDTWGNSWDPAKDQAGAMFLSVGGNDKDHFDPGWLTLKFTDGTTARIQLPSYTIRHVPKYKLPWGEETFLKWTDQRGREFNGRLYLGTDGASYYDPKGTVRAAP